jgi:hypothetical protein
MTRMGSTLSKKSLIPGWDKSSIRKLKVGMGQSGRGGVGGGNDGGGGAMINDHDNGVRCSPSIDLCVPHVAEFI